MCDSCKRTYGAFSLNKFHLILGQRKHSDWRRENRSITEEMCPKQKILYLKITVSFKLILST